MLPYSRKLKTELIDPSIAQDLRTEFYIDHSKVITNLRWVDWGMTHDGSLVFPNARPPYNALSGGLGAVRSMYLYDDTQLLCQSTKNDLLVAMNNLMKSNNYNMSISTQLTNMYVAFNTWENPNDNVEMVTIPPFLSNYTVSSDKNTTAKMYLDLKDISHYCETWSLLTHLFLKD